VTSLGKKISLFHVLSQNTHRKVEDLRQRICFLWLYAADDVRPPSQFYYYSNCDISLINQYNFIIITNWIQQCTTTYILWGEQMRKASGLMFLVLRSKYNYIGKSSELKQCTYADQLVYVWYDQIATIMLFKIPSQPIGHHRSRIKQLTIWIHIN
jgi:hypothetical protein